MNDNKDNSLFTEMFGLPSEQPTEPPTPKPETEPIQNPQTANLIQENNIKEPAPVVEKPLIEEAPTETVTLNSSLDISNLNYQENKQDNLPKEEPLIEMTPTKKEVEEVITLTPGIVQETTQVEQQPLTENNVLYSPEYIQTPTPEAPIVKKNKIVFNIIISILTGLSLCLGWYFVYTEFLSPDIEEKESTEQLQEQPTPEEKEEPIVEEPKLTFDENLSFFKGLTTNELELHKEQPFTPQEETGVVKCESITPINVSNLFYSLNEYYIYYEKHLTKKVLIVQTSTYQNQSSYADSLSAYSELENAWAGKEGIKYTIKKYPENNKVENYILINLAYGSYFVTDRDSKVFYKFEFDYNDKVAEVEKIIMNIEVNQGNIYCSSVITK